jgi:hypothetical protein
MKFSLISLIALALTSTSVMAAAQPVAIEKRDILTTISHRIEKGRKNPQTSAPSTGFYDVGDHITITCYTEKNTTPILGSGIPDR